MIKRACHYSPSGASPEGFGFGHLPYSTPFALTLKLLPSGPFIAWLSDQRSKADSAITIRVKNRAMCQIMEL